MKLKQIDALKACVHLQKRMDWVEQRQTWLSTKHTGWKKHFKAFFLSKWNSGLMAFTVSGLTALGMVVSDMFLPHNLAGIVGLMLYGSMFSTFLIYIEKIILVGSSERWGLKPVSCEISVLDTMMAVFEEAHPDLAAPFVEQLKRLKNNDLNIYQAGKIANILSNYLKISKDDAIVHLLNSTPLDSVQVREETLSPEKQVSNAPFLRL